MPPGGGPEGGMPGPEIGVVVLFADPGPTMGDVVMPSFGRPPGLREGMP